MLDPDDRNVFLPGLFDQAADVRDDGVALVRPPDDAVLHVDDEQCGVRPVLESGHRVPFAGVYVSRGAEIGTRDPDFCPRQAR